MTRKFSPAQWMTAPDQRPVPASPTRPRLSQQERQPRNAVAREIDGSSNLLVFGTALRGFLTSGRFIRPFLGLIGVDDTTVFFVTPSRTPLELSFFPLGLWE